MEATSLGGVTRTVLFAGQQPDVSHTDQGVQFTSASDVQRLQAAHIRISWDDRGRPLENIFVERVRRSLKRKRSRSRMEPLR